MELLISALAMCISFISIIISIVIYMLGISRDKKQATLDAINILQDQVFDNINKYTYKEIQDICNNWKNDNWTEDKELQLKLYNEYKVLSGYLARIEHFALGVNTGIYNSKIVHRAATKYLISLYSSKLKPLIDSKHSNSNGIEYYSEFRIMTEKINKISND